jgi:beta-glucosidase/6-phospho-beta-glucosidase/beta-galactosidase
MQTTEIYPLEQVINDKNPFKSFWMAGYECTDKLNVFGNRVDFLTVTGHLDLLEEDYDKLDQFKIKTVREGIRWSHVEKKPYEYDWTTLRIMIECGIKKGIQQVWDICHFGFPDDLTPLHPSFTPRFVALCRSFVKYYRTIDPVNTLIVTPINEVGFLSWLGGDRGATVPYCKHYGWEVKYELMKAYIAGIEAMLEEDDSVRILITEPLVSMVAPLNATEAELAKAAKAHEEQFQVLEMLSGKLCPELGGRPEYLDIIGLNYYYNNQWITGTHECLSWFNEYNDPRWKPVSDLMINVYQRYNRPIILAETSHPKEHRPLWIEFITDECIKVLKKRIPLLGVCWYPVIDRPDWDHLYPWHQSGIWDVFMNDEGAPFRHLYQPLAKALLKAQSATQATIEQLESIKT